MFVHDHSSRHRIVLEVLAGVTLAAARETVNRVAFSRFAAPVFRSGACRYNGRLPFIVSLVNQQLK